ncbi:MAG: rRNA-processing protein and EBNA1-binding protein ebp2 [Trizodia sp. TS-e1964]|nr:MAG: rRNA-processing protein and EBNA1-binding protein ebp2 [Trizodia sp. TS-e1964]
MPQKSRLKAALDSRLGKDYNAERQKKLRKAASKKKKSRKVEAEVGDDDEEEGGDEEEVPALVEEPEVKELEGSEEEEEVDGEGSEGVPVNFDISHIDDSDSESSASEDEEDGGVTFKGLSSDGEEKELDEEEDDGEQEEDIALSDIEDMEDRADLIPHQRLTINNKPALLKALQSIGISTAQLPFSEHQCLSTAEPVSIPDIDDDLNRELAFYKQSLAAVKEGRVLLKKEGLPFSRPTDYFAEMVKSDDHMDRIKHKMIDEAASKKAAAEARKQRDLKKFGKQVQVAKLQERDKAKRETMDKIKVLKRKRQGADTGDAEEADLFDVVLDDAAKGDKRSRETRGAGGGAKARPGKRQKKDEKFGFGGKKRFAKSGDAVSSGDLRGFSARKMKDQKGGKQRLGKSRRAKVG